MHWLGTQVSAVPPVFDPATRTLKVRLDMNNPGLILKPDMYATVALGEGEPHSVVTVPSAAVQDIDGKTVVFVETGDGRFARREVTVDAERDSQVAVRAGLQAGERIVAQRDQQFITRVEEWHSRGRLRRRDPSGPRR